MEFLSDLPISRKLTLVTMLPTALALLLAGLVFVGYERGESRQSLLEEMRSAAQIIGDGSAAALTFSDPSSAAETLDSLAAHSEVAMSVIYDVAGVPFSVYRSEGLLPGALRPPPVEANGYRFSPATLEVFHGIEIAGEPVGTVYIRASLAAIRAELLRASLVVAIAILVASGVAFLLISQWKGTISGPISHLSEIASRVADEQDYSLRARKAGSDEMGDLVDRFNGMLGEIQARDAALHDAQAYLELRVSERTRELEMEIVERRRAEAEIARIHKELLAASRQAGMAEVASNVLHNVGNVLNSVNVSADMVVESVRESRLAGLGRVVSLLREKKGDLAGFFSVDARGARLPSYLAKLYERLCGEQSVILAELELLRRNIEHVKEIVAMQQSYAQVAGVIELVEVADLVEDSLRINAGALERHGVRAIRELATVPPLNVDKHKVLQILVNLLRNAKYACDDSGRVDKLVTLRVTNGGDRVRIIVTDNGVGIPAENLTMIFRNGFTTRIDGHGFGLHSSALAASEMGGALIAHSDGVGEGATFTLELPLWAPEARQ